MTLLANVRLRIAVISLSMLLALLTVSAKPADAFMRNNYCGHGTHVVKSWGWGADKYVYSGSYNDRETGSHMHRYKHYKWGSLIDSYYYVHTDTKHCTNW